VQLSNAADLLCRKKREPISVRVFDEERKSSKMRRREEPSRLNVVIEAATYHQLN
jgi:hypothetical protein